MFHRISTYIVVLFFALAAAASAVPRTDPPPAVPSCSANTGPIQCCNKTTTKSGLSPVESLLAGLLGVVLGDIAVTDVLGLTCSPLTIIGVSGNSCNGQAVCCSNNSFNGLIALGCTPININL